MEAGAADKVGLLRQSGVNFLGLYIYVDADVCLIGVRVNVESRKMRAGSAKEPHLNRGSCLH